MAERCIWCNGSDGTVSEQEIGTERGPIRVYVHDRHLDDVRRFCSGAARFERRLLPAFLIALMFSSVVVAVIGTISPAARSLLVGMLLIALATSIWIYPYATPFTVGWLGMRRSITLARILALVVIGFGLLEMLPSV